jgi:hypothetical protein
MEYRSMIADVWSSILAAIPDVAAWNRNLPEFKRLTEQYGQDCRAFIKAEAERRGYLWSKDSREYMHPWRILACEHQGKRIVGVGWRSGQLAVIFTDKTRLESAEKNIPSSLATGLVTARNPDAFYASNVEGVIPMEMVD